MSRCASLDTLNFNKEAQVQVAEICGFAGFPVGGAAAFSSVPLFATISSFPSLSLFLLVNAYCAEKGSYYAQNCVIGSFAWTVAVGKEQICTPAFKPAFLVRKPKKNEGLH